MRGFLSFITDIQQLLFFTAGITASLSLLVLRALLLGLDVGVGLGVLRDNDHFSPPRNRRFSIPAALGYRTCVTLLDLRGLFLRLALHLLQDVVKLLIAGLVVRVVGSMFLQKIFAHLQLLLNIGGD